MNYIFRDTVGRLVKQISGIDAADAALNLDAVAVAWVEFPMVVDPRTTWIDPTNDGLYARPLQSTAIDKLSIAADGSDTATITGAPAGALLTAIQVATEAEAGDVLAAGTGYFSTNIPGDYRLRVSHFPHQDWEVTIHAS